MAVLRIERLPADPLAAAQIFHADWLPRAMAELGEDLTLVFPTADHTHRAWRLAAIQGLARQAAPARVNAIAASEAEAIATALAYLAAAPGLTGQYMQLDGAGAGIVLESAA